MDVGSILIDLIKSKAKPNNKEITKTEAEKILKDSHEHDHEHSHSEDQKTYSSKSKKSKKLKSTALKEKKTKKVSKK